MKLPTDKQLEKRANRLSYVAGPGADEVSVDYMEAFDFAYARATLEALKVDRESLRLLHGRDHKSACKAHWNIIGGEPRQCTCGLDTHIALLKKRLGIEQEP